MIYSVLKALAIAMAAATGLAFSVCVFYILAYHTPGTGLPGGVVDVPTPSFALSSIVGFLFLVLGRRNVPKTKIDDHCQKE